MIASAVIDLPEPDSPAMQSVSPRLKSKDRSETTSRSPSSLRTLTVKPATLEHRTGRAIRGDCPGSFDVAH